MAKPGSDLRRGASRSS